VFVAAVTPHRKEGHEADIGAVLELIDYLCAAGVSGIALLGSTGEFPHLTHEDRMRLLGMAVKRSRVPVIAGVGDTTLDGAVALAEHAAGAGAAGLLIMPPFFFRYEQPEVREFFLRFAAEVNGSAPVFLYNIPFFTTPIDCGTACALLAGGGFAGIKDSSGRIEYFEQLRRQREQTPFTLMVGNDAVFTRARCGGADGVVSGVACAVPELLLGLDSAIRLGLSEKIGRLEKHLQDFIAWIARFPAPIGVKEATAARGLKVGPLAVPLSPGRERDLAEFREWFLGWLPQVQRDAQ
jgi:4-hydroxy-tetrahydrodipicolinate synthase